MRVGLLVLAALLLGCGDGAGGSKGRARPTPDDGGIAAMRPGLYRSSVFRPAVTFRTDRDLYQREIETRDSLSLWDTGRSDRYTHKESWMHLYRPHAMYDPSRPAEGREWPGDMIAFLQDHPDLEATPRPGAEVGGFPARVIDLRPRTDVALWMDSAEQENLINEHHLVRVYVIDAGGEQRLAVLNVPAKKGPKAFEALERILRTVRFDDA